MRSESRRVSGWTAARELAPLCSEACISFLFLRALGLWHLLFWIEPVNLAAAGADDFGCWRPLRRLDLAGNGPDETNQFARNGCDRNHALFAHGQLFEAFVQALLRLPGNEPQLLVLMLLPFLHGLAHQGFEPVMPRRFGEHAPAMGIAAFGNTAEHPFVAAGVLAGSQSEKVVEWLGVFKL